MPTPWLSPEFTPGLVSVVIPTFNRAGLLRQTLDSIAVQDYRPLEVIVLDDGSTDGTSALLADYRMPDGISLRVEATAHAGAASARNRGAAASRGEFVMFVDSDDVLHIGAVTALAAGIGEADLCHAAWRDWFSDEVPPRYSEPYARGPAADLLTGLLRNEWLMQGAVMHRRTNLLGSGCWDESFSIEDDFEFMVRVARSTGRVAAIPQLVADYRRHAGSQLSQRAALEKSQAVERVLRKVEAELGAGMSAQRRDALAWRWFWEARRAWVSLHDADRLESLLGEARRVLPGFRPPKSWYRWIASLAGYANAERVAAIGRRLLR